MVDGESGDCSAVGAEQSGEVVEGEIVDLGM